MAENDVRLETLEDEVKVLKGEVKRTLVDLRALLMREDSPLGEGGFSRRAPAPEAPAPPKQEVTEVVTPAAAEPTPVAQPEPAPVAAAPAPEPVTAAPGPGPGAPPGAPPANFAPGPGPGPGPGAFPGPAPAAQPFPAPGPGPGAPPGAPPANFAPAPGPGPGPDLGALAEQERRIADQERRIEEQERRMAQREQEMREKEEETRKAQRDRDRRDKDNQRRLDQKEQELRDRGEDSLRNQRAKARRVDEDLDEEEPEQPAPASESKKGNRKAKTSTRSRQEADEALLAFDEEDEDTDLDMEDGEFYSEEEDDDLFLEEEDEDEELDDEEEEILRKPVAKKSRRVEAVPAKKLKSKDQKASPNGKNIKPDEPDMAGTELTELPNEEAAPSESRAVSVYDEYWELLKETREAPPTEDTPGGPPLDVNLLSSLVHWTSLAKRRVGEQQLKDILELYIQSGHSRPELQELLLHISTMVEDAPEEPADGPEQCVDLMFHLHGILTGGLPVVKIPQMQFASRDSGNEADAGSED